MANAGKLTGIVVSQAKASDKVQKLADGGGLYLRILPNGGKYWRYRYRFADKAKELALGVYPEVSLKQARKAHQEARDKLASGIDPSELRKVERLTQKQAAANSFEALSIEWIETQLSDKTDGHRKRSERFLLKDLAALSARPINEITAPELLAALRRIEARGTIETAHRVKQLAGRVFSYAISTGRAERNPAADLGNNVLKPRKTQHRAAITEPKELGKLLRDIEQSASGIVVKTALQLTPILFQRPTEIRHMEWQEIDFEKSLWFIPADKMKMRNEHIVPLPKQAIELIRNIQPLTGRGKYVFPSARGASRCMSDNGVRTALRDLGYSNEQVTPHGFRATARTLLDEVLGFRVDWIEQQLAHAVKDPNGRAYNRTKHLPQRVEMMQAWADYLDKLRKGAEVIPFKQA